MPDVIKVGVVAYDPKVVTIWEGIKEYFTARNVAMDFILFSNYEAQVDALLDRWIDIAWNTNLAYVKVDRRTGGNCGVLAMRDVLEHAEDLVNSAIDIFERHKARKENAMPWSSELKFAKFACESEIQ